MPQAACRPPERRTISVTNSGFHAIELLNAVRHRLCVIIRLRLDARLFDAPKCCNRLICAACLPLDWRLS
jgi:hypothetical protein